VKLAHVVGFIIKENLYESFKKLFHRVLLKEHPSCDENLLQDLHRSLAATSLPSCYVTSVTKDKYTVEAI
jgi:hypothetical protein